CRQAGNGRERDGEKGSRKGRVASGVSEQVAVGAVVEDAVARPDGGLAVLEGVPGQADPRLEIPVLVVVEGAAGPGPYRGKGKGSRTARVHVEIRKVIVDLKRHAVVFPAQPVGESEVRAQLPGVLSEQTDLALPETA